MENIKNYNPFFSNAFEINFSTSLINKFADKILSYKWFKKENHIKIDFIIEQNDFFLFETLNNLKKNKINGYNIYLNNFFKDGNIFRKIIFKNVFIYDFNYLEEGTYEEIKLSTVSTYFYYDFFEIEELWKNTKEIKN